MNYYIIGIIVLIIVCTFSYYQLKNNVESFDNYNLITNGNFRNGDNVSDLVSTESNFSVVSMPNPGNTSYVLRQDKYNKSAYDISVSVENNKYYFLSYWRTNTQNYNGTDYDLEIYGGEQKLTNRGKVIKISSINNYRWKKIIYIVNSSNNNKLNVKLGNVGKFTTGFRYYCDLNFKQYLPELPEFNLHDGLKSMFIVDDISVSEKIIKDKSGRMDLEFENKINLENNLIDLNNNSGKIKNSDIKVKFTIFFSYESAENESGTLFEINSNNQNNSGIKIELLNTGTVNNKISITVMGKNYQFNLGINNKLTNYFIAFDGVNLGLGVDNILLRNSAITNLTEKGVLGTCPDGWKHLGNNKCMVQDVNAGTCDGLQDFSERNKAEWAKQCSVQWTNCKVLNKGEIAPMTNSDCNDIINLDLTNQEIKINNFKSLRGKLYSLIIYDRVLKKSDFDYLHKYITMKSINRSGNDLNMNMDRPTINKYNGPSYSSNMNNNTRLRNMYNINNSSSSRYVNALERPSLLKTSGMDQNVCPFDDPSLCDNIDCSCVNWKTMYPMPEKCKKKVNNYCRDNFKDPKCRTLRQNKCKKSYSIPNSGKSNANNSNNHGNNLDLSSYIQRDRIPCWGCNL